MADTKKGRDKKARDEEKRQRKREVEEERRRADEPEPDENLGDRTGEEPMSEGDDAMPEETDEILEEEGEFSGDMGEMPEADLAGGDEELPVDQRDRDDRAQHVGKRDPDSQLGEVDDLLEERDYPVSAEEMVADHGRQEIEVDAGKTTLEEVLLPEDDESFDSAEELRERIEDRLERG